jgi:hypothetical protein
MEQGTEMRKLGQVLMRIVFWSYERGSWPYDVMVVTIVIFVLLTPRSWFHDQPESSYAISSGVQLVSQDPDSQTRVYRLDAQILRPEKRTSKSTPELERETHDILGRKVQELQDQTFQLIRIDPVRGADGSVIYYDVTLHL